MINGNIIKAKIYEKGYKIKDIAKLINVNDMTLTNWINGRNITQIDKFIELLILLDINIKEIKIE